MADTTVFIIISVILFIIFLILTIVLGRLSPRPALFWVFLILTILIFIGIIILAVLNSGSPTTIHGPSNLTNNLIWTGAIKV